MAHKMRQTCAKLPFATPCVIRGAVGVLGSPRRSTKVLIAHAVGHDIGATPPEGRGGVGRRVQRWTLPLALCAYGVPRMLSIQMMTPLRATFTRDGIRMLRMTYVLMLLTVAPALAQD